MKIALQKSFEQQKRRPAIEDCALQALVNALPFLALLKCFLSLKQKTSLLTGITCVYFK